MPLKIRGDHLRCQIINKCLDVRRRIKMVSFLLLLSCELSVSVKENLGKRKIPENFDFVEK